MKQVLQFRRSGETRVVEVPAPLTPSGGLLVQNRWSLISPGTERMLVEAGGANLLNTARQRPDLVRHVLDKAAREGVAATVQAVRSRIDVAIPLGYSCAGTVLTAGSEMADFKPGDRVACAGAGQANHAEVVAVHKHLAARIPEAVSFEDAAFVTVGAIAMQGLRIADVRLGEACVVIGLGLVGQLCVQLLKAAGCRVFGVDMARDKVDLACRSGADDGCERADPALHERVRTFTSGRGADSILIAAAAATSDPVQLAPSLARDRAVVTMVGMTGMDVPRNAYYEKELQVRLSRSYGPGRYDRTYEELGVDYPIGFVRWTEQRNMEAFLDLVAEGKVQPAQLVTHRVPIAEAQRAYQIVTGEVAEPYLGILLEYPAQQPLADTRVEVNAAPPRARGARPSVRLGLIGAGNFARSTLLPALKKMDVELLGVATASGPSAQQNASRFGFRYAATEWQQVVEDPEVDAVVVATRHDLHATVASAALQAGKSVFLEKPMALSSDELEELMAVWRASGQALQVGFNRRFAPTYVRMKSSLAARRGPLAMGYRVNAGSVAPTSWVVDPVQGGGRLIGEVCHMVDLLVDLAGARVATVFAQPGQRDDVVLALSFEDGSVGTVLYASGGDRAQPKERIEVLGDGRSAVLDDFRTLRLYAGGHARRIGGLVASQDKGHLAELQAFVDSVRSGRPAAVDANIAAHVTRVTFAALESTHSGLPVTV